MTDTATTETTVLATGPLPDPPSTDHWTVRLVVVSIATIVLAVIIGTIVLVLNGHEMPDVLLTLGGVGVGSLGSLLASTRSTSSRR